MGHVCRKVHAWHDSGQLICIVQRHTFRARSMRKEITVLRRCSGDDRAARRSCAIRSWLQLGLFDCGMIWGMLHASMLTFGVSPLVSIVVALVVGAIVKLIDAVKPAKGLSPPAVWHLPIIGDLLLFTLFKVNPLELRAKRLKQYGPIYRIWLFGQRAVVVHPPELVNKILGGEGTLVQSDWPKSVKAMLGPWGVTVTTGEAHARLRRDLNPAFRTSILARSIPAIVKFATQYCNRWADEGVISGYKACKGFPFKVMAGCLLGYEDTDMEAESFQQIRTALTEWLKGLFSIPIDMPGTAYHNGLVQRKFLIDKMKEHALQLQQRERGTSETETCAEALIHLKDEEDGTGYSADAIADILLTLVFAGHETTAAALLTLFRELPLHPEVTARLRAEQEQVMREHGQEITAEALSAMEYADAVSKEALRYRVIVPFVFRRALKDFQLGPYTIKKGTTIQADLITTIKEDPRWLKHDGPDAPDKFYPDRWLTAEGRSIGGWIPFGGGIRMCLGWRLTMLELKVMLAVMARGYEWKQQDPSDWNDVPRYRKPDGMKIQFARTKGAA